MSPGLYAAWRNYMVEAICSPVLQTLNENFENSTPLKKMRMIQRMIHFYVRPYYDVLNEILTAKSLLINVHDKSIKYGMVVGNAHLGLCKILGPSKTRADIGFIKHLELEFISKT